MSLRSVNILLHYFGIWTQLSDVISMKQPLSRPDCKQLKHIILIRCLFLLYRKNSIAFNNLITFYLVSSIHIKISDGCNNLRYSKLPGSKLWGFFPGSKILFCSDPSTLILSSSLLIQFPSLIPGTFQLFGIKNSATLVSLFQPLCFESGFGSR